MREFDNGSPSAKHRRLSQEHRLSTDSLGSNSDRSSPYRAPHSPHRGALSPGGASPRPKPPSNFSIDSIMGGGGLPKPQLTPSRGTSRPPQLPLAPTPTRPSPTPTKTPPPANPFASILGGYPGLHPLQQALLQQQLLNQGLDPRLALLDPRIAQLAGLADPRLQSIAADPRLQAMQADPRLQAMQADPRLTPGSAYPFGSPDPRLQALLNPYGAFSPFASAASSLPTSSSGSVWTPPVATAAGSTSASTPPPSTIAPPRQFASSPQHPQHLLPHTEQSPMRGCLRPWSSPPDWPPHSGLAWG